FWCENGMVNLGGEKMSKSTGNLFFIDDIAAQVDPEVVRYYLLSTHYRSPIDFTLERLKEAAIAYQRLRLPLERAGVWDPVAGSGAAEVPGGTLGEAVAGARRLFAESMEDDFNSARAIGHLFDLAREVNRALDGGAGQEGRLAARALYDLGQVLGLFWKPPAGETWEPEVLALVEARERARKSRDWVQADEVRARLLERGVSVEDSAQGPKLKRK
ncbi:MAG: DALR domain-containing protein, partial [Candidatus Eisenbacteria bacterium]